MHGSNDYVLSLGLVLTVVVAAGVGVTPGAVALDSVRTMLRGAVLGACVLRADWFTALAFIALVVLALHLLGVVNQSVSVGALNGVAALRF